MADKYLKQDGSVFLFKPGKGGSLTDTRKREVKPWDVGPTARVAKVVPILRSRRKAVQIDTGSSRG